jgi:GTP cyclohydrolase IA
MTDRWYDDYDGSENGNKAGEPENKQPESSLPKHTPEELVAARETLGRQQQETQERMKQSIPEGWPHAYNMNSQGEPWTGKRNLSVTQTVQVPDGIDPLLSGMLTQQPLPEDSSSISEWLAHVEPVPSEDLGVDIDFPEVNDDEDTGPMEAMLTVIDDTPPEHPLHPWSGKFIQSGSQEHREYAVAQLLIALGVNLHDANFKETPRRMAAYLTEHFQTEKQVADEVELLKRAVFPSKYGDMVTERGIKTSGMCPHHLLPVQYTVDVGYLPGASVIGISKLARIPMLLSGRPILQEDYTHQIAEAMQQVLGVQDVAVVVKGVHMCMVVRGVEQGESDTVTSVMCGKFLENFRDCKNEFLALARK